VTFALSPPVRYAALLALLGAVLIGGGMTMLGHGGSTAAATPHVIKHHPFGLGSKTQTTAAPQKHSSHATKPKTTTPKATPHVAAAPKATPHAAAAPKAPEQPAAVLAAIAAGLPNPLAAALGRKQVVVVALYNPYSDVDGIAFAEARAGARIAGVGFVGLNVLSEAQVGKLTQTLGLLPDPGFLVYARPGTLVAKISGFADKETVAQAAQNAAHGA
jgi:hypothetical protein